MNEHSVSSLLWPELSINQCSQIIISEVHKFLISTDLSFQIAINFTISEIYHKGYHIYTRELLLERPILGTKEAFIRQQQQQFVIL